RRAGRSLRDRASRGACRERSCPHLVRAGARALRRRARRLSRRRGARGERMRRAPYLVRVNRPSVHPSGGRAARTVVLRSCSFTLLSRGGTSWGSVGEAYLVRVNLAGLT